MQRARVAGVSARPSEPAAGAARGCWASLPRTSSCRAPLWRRSRCSFRTGGWLVGAQDAAPSARCAARKSAPQPRRGRRGRLPTRLAVQPAAQRASRAPGGTSFPRCLRRSTGAGAQQRTVNDGLVRLQGVAHRLRRGAACVSRRRVAARRQRLLTPPHASTVCPCARGVRRAGAHHRAGVVRLHQRVQRGARAVVVHHVRRQLLARRRRRRGKAGLGAHRVAVRPRRAADSPAGTAGVHAAARPGPGRAAEARAKLEKASFGHADFCCRTIFCAAPGGGFLLASWWSGAMLTNWGGT